MSLRQGRHLRGPVPRDGLPVRPAGHAGAAGEGQARAGPGDRRGADLMSTMKGAGEVGGAEVQSVAADGGAPAMEAVSLYKDFRIGRGLIAARGARRQPEPVPRGRGRAGRRERLGQVDGGPAAGRAGAAHLGHDPARRPAGGPVRPRRLPPPQERGPARLPGPVRLAQPRAHRQLPPGAPGAAAPGPQVQGRGQAGDRRPAGAGPADPGRASSAASTRTSCPAGSASGSRSPGRWRPSPRVLLADEPVSMLDVSIRLEMLSLLDDLRRGSGWRCSTSPTTSPRPGTSPTRCWSCTAGRSSSAARPSS